MPAATLRAELSAELAAFAWGVWAQMGVSGAAPVRAERRAIDPEALLLLTLEVGRDDPRLLDEALDWLVHNEALISVHRLRGLCGGDLDRSLVAAALDWSALWGPRAKAASKWMTDGRESPAGVPLFRDAGSVGSATDVAFARHGWLREPLTPSRKSRAPDLLLPVNLALRLRKVFGVGVRAEVARALLTIDAPQLESQVVAASAGFAQRNVREGLAQLVEGGVVDVVRAGDDRTYAMPRDRWTTFLNLEPSELPRHYDWIPALRAVVKVLRWLGQSDVDLHSEYIRASQARTLMESVEPDLRYAGIRTYGETARGADYWPEFERTARGAVRHIVTGGP